MAGRNVTVEVALCSSAARGEAERRARAAREGRAALLRYARRLARRRAGRHPAGFSTVDDVHDALVRSGHGPSSLGSAAGSIFRTRGWAPTRLRVKSRRPASRGREIHVWRLAGDAAVRAREARGAPPYRIPPGYALLIDDYWPRRSPRNGNGALHLRGGSPCEN